MNKKEPIRLQKRQEEDIFTMLNKDVVFKIKFYLIMAIAMIIFLAFCFIVQHQTYGFINW